VNDFPQRPLKAGDVYPAHVLRDRFGINAENRPYFTVAAEEVPESLRELIPYVERWAIPCDVTRGDYFDQQPPADVAEFYRTVLPYRDRINTWLDAQPEQVANWSDAAVQYMYLLKAHGEAYQPTEEELQARAEGLARHRRNLAKEAAVDEAEEAFRAKDYERVTRLLTPFEDELEKIHAAKLTLARKKR